jgi:hypothetical protein
MSTTEEAFYNLVSQGATGKAINEMIGSQMPGRENGPADAYRHILLAAELTRRYGEVQARILLDGHEFTGDLGGQNPDAGVMDVHNNQLGIDLGNRLRQDPFNTGWNDVVNGARSLIDPSNDHGDTARWLPESSWGTNPTDDDTGVRMANDDPRLKWPNPDWPQGPYEFKRDALFDDFFDATDAVREQLRDYVNSFTNDLISAIGAIFNGDEWGALIDDLTANLFTAAHNYVRPPAPVRCEPLILDLNGNGIETVGIDTAKPILFDHNADGVKTASGWVNANDGLLVWDRNGNGTIDNGRELFGDATTKSDGTLATDGFNALADLDINNDGIVNAQDSDFAKLKVWRDLNQDGISQSSELFSLDTYQIAGINLANTTVNTAQGNDNILNETGSYIRSDGTTGLVGDVSFANNSFYSRFVDALPLSAKIQALPDMQGAGMVRGLRDAASRSAQLAATLSQYAAATSDIQKSMLDNMLSQWSATSTFTTSADRMDTLINGVSRVGRTTALSLPDISMFDNATEEKAKAKTKMLFGHRNVKHKQHPRPRLGGVGNDTLNGDIGEAANNEVWRDAA